MSDITILHLSDLHYDSDREFDRNIVIEALLKDIRDQRASGITFDVVIFSGDLVQAGDSEKSYERAVSYFIDPVLEAAGLGINELIIAPGNHDISRKKVVPFIDTGLRSSLKSVAEINDFVDRALTLSDTATQAALERMDPYEAFYKGLGISGENSSNTFFKTRTLILNGLKVGFASLNSAWRATGEKSDKDHLIVGERVVDRALADLDRADIRVCVMHHPFDWLTPEDSSAIEDRILGSFDLICVGHTHRQFPQYRLSPLGGSVVSQGGALYASRKYFNGYQIIRWDEPCRKVRFQCRAYFDNPRRSFSPSENIAPGGLYEVDLRPRIDKPQLSEIELFLRQARAGIRAAADEHISFARPRGEGRRDDISEAFVCPPLQISPGFEIFIKGESDAERKQREITADAILRDARHVILNGLPESGRTSLLHYFAVRVSEGVIDQARIPAVITVPISVRKANPTGEDILKSYERTLRGYFSEANIKPMEFYTAFKSLPWVVLLDDFNGSRTDHLEFLGGLLERYPSHRFVIMTSQGAPTRNVDKILGGDTLKVGIEFLSRRNIRQLSRVRFAGSLESGVEDPAYQMIMKHLNDARLPRTGYMVALLLWAAEQDQLGKDLNEAVLLENLVSFLLGKTQFEAALRNQFDARAQERLLRAIAYELKKVGGWLASNMLLEFIIEYFKSRGLGFGAKEVLDEFIACRLLIEIDGYVGFRYSCYQEYFVALDLRHDAKRLSSLLNDTGTAELVRYGRELDLWSSLSREMEGADEALVKALASEKLDPKTALPDLQELEFIGQDIKFSRARVRELLDNPPTKDQIDEILDRADRARTSIEHKPPSPDKGGPDGKSVSDPKEPNDVARAILSLTRQRSILEILTRIVRNADHEKIEAKGRISATLLRLWSAHTLAISKALADLVDEVASSMDLGHSKLTPDDLNRMANIFKLVVTYVDAGTVAATLTNNSLRQPFLEISLNDDNPEGLRFLAALSYAGTWDKLGINLVRKAFKSLQNKVLRQAVLEKMLNDYKLQRYQTAFGDEFRELIAETEIAVQGASKVRKGRRIADLQEQEEE